MEYDADGYVIESGATLITVNNSDNTGNMNTTLNADRGYAYVNSPRLTLRGATLYTQTAQNNNYVILDEDVVFYVENADGDYDRYTNPDAAINSATPVTGTPAEDDVISVDKVAAICDSSTGYATTVIIDLNFQGETSTPSGTYRVQQTSAGVITPNLTATSFSISNAGVYQVASGGSTSGYAFGTATMSVKVELINSGTYLDMGTYTGTVTGTGGGSCVITGSIAMPNLPNGDYRLTVTISNSDIGTLSVYSGYATIS